MKRIPLILIASWLIVLTVWAQSAVASRTGYITNRLFASGKTQSLKWDAAGRLVSLTQRANPTNGFNWTAIYDALGRRLRTIQVPVVNGVTNSVMTLTLDSYYDPQVEFEELAVAVNGQRTWKVMGPDLDGHYGSMQGVGGLEATVRESDLFTTPVLNDYFGNVVATIASGTANWSPIRVGSYGPLPGYEASTLSLSTPLAEALVWRGRAVDATGFYWLGARYYDPMAGRFISPDPLGHGASMDLYSFCSGDPLNQFDPTGRIGKGVGYWAADKIIDFETMAWNVADAVLNPLVGQVDPASAKMNFPGGHESGPSYSIGHLNSASAEFGYIGADIAWTVGFQAGLLLATDGLGELAEGGLGLGELGGADLMGESRQLAEEIPENFFDAEGQGQFGYMKDLPRTQVSTPPAALPQPNIAAPLAVQLQLSLAPQTGPSYLAAKSATQLEFQFAPKVEQYALRAADSGFYPVMVRGSENPQFITYLEKGDVWKFGTTANPATRYSGSYLQSIGEHGVEYSTEFLGTEQQAVQLQNMKIQNFLQQTGKLPPGNKIIN